MLFFSLSVDMIDKNIDGSKMFHNSNKIITQSKQERACTHRE